MPRLLIVSNRLPIFVEKRAGELHFEPSITGLVTGLKPLHKRHSSIWIGWPGIEQEEIEGEEKEFEKRLSSKGYHPVFLSKQNVEGFYHGFCNKTVCLCSITSRCTQNMMKVYGARMSGSMRFLATQFLKLRNPMILSGYTTIS